MEKKKVIHPDRDANFVTGAYSDGIIVGNFLFVSGQAAVDFKTSKFGQTKNKSMNYSDLTDRSDKFEFYNILN